MSIAGRVVSSLAPFFVIGSPRSGTTLLRLMLTSHPQLVVPPECGFLVWLYPTFGRWGREEFTNPAEVRRFANAVEGSRKFETWKVSAREIVDAVLARRSSSYAEACECVYRIFCARAGKPEATWGDKNNFYLSHVAIISAIFPDARFIHIVRDGRDVACSYREVMTAASTSPYRPVLPVEISKIAQQWLHDLKVIREQFLALPSGTGIELRYEDLVKDSGGQLMRICDWLGVPFSPEMLCFYDINRARYLEPMATMDWKQRTLEPVTTNRIGIYAELLNDAEMAEFTTIAGTELRRYGYLECCVPFIRDSNKGG